MATGYFLRRPPPQPPQSSETLAGQAGQSLTSPSCLPSPSPEGPQSTVNFPGDFLGEILALPSKCFGTPKKSLCKNPRKRLYKLFLQTVRTEFRAKNRAKNRAKICAENLCRKSVQKIRAKTPCRKSVQKIRAETCAKNMCKTNPCKRLPQSNIAN